jgi:hypothetical protein
MMRRAIAMVANGEKQTWPGSFIGRIPRRADQAQAAVGICESTAAKRLSNSDVH